MNYTKGPWSIGDTDGCFTAIDSKEDNHWALATVVTDLEGGCWWPGDKEKLLGNLRLIKSAPELLEALEEMLKEFRELDLPYGSAAYVKANSIVNKVKGV